MAMVNGESDARVSLSGGCGEPYIQLRVHVDGDFFFETDGNHAS